MFVGEGFGPFRRSEVVQALFAVSAPWFTLPAEVMRLDHATGDERRTRWPATGDAPPLVNAPLTRTQLLFVYSRAEFAGVTPPCVSIEEHAEHKQAVYGVSVPIHLPIKNGVAETERWVWRLYGTLAWRGKDCILTVRDEGGLSCGVPLDQVLDEALGATLNAAWVIGPERLIRPRIPDAEPIRPSDAAESCVVVRRRGLLEGFEASAGTPIRTSGRASSPETPA